MATPAPPTSPGPATPVMFDPFSEDFFVNPYDTYRRLRDEAPVYRDDTYGFYALSRYDDVLAAHRDFRTFSSEHGLTIDALTDPDYVNRPSIITMDPPAHDRMRKLVSRVFTPRAVTALDDLMRDIIGGFLDQLEGRDAFDLVAEFSAPFPVEVITTVLGVPKEDRQQIRHWTDLSLSRERGNPNPTPAGMEAAMKSYAYYLSLVADKRAHPADDMVSRLCEVTVERDDGGMTTLTDAEIAGFASLLAAAGSETVTKLIGNGVVLFARNPAEWQKVLDDPTRSKDAVEEILRYWPPSQYQGRFSALESTYAGVTIPAGVPVLLLTGAACRDERSFEEPDRFDIDRDQKVSVGFGHGIHACLGAALARQESRIAFEEIARRWPRYEVDEDRCARVYMSNVAGYSNVPVRVVA